jgi:hypothetical protein
MRAMISKWIVFLAVVVTVMGIVAGAVIAGTSGGGGAYSGNKNGTYHKNDTYN